MPYVREDAHHFDLVDVFENAAQENAKYLQPP